MNKIRIKNRKNQELSVLIENQVKGKELVFIAHGLGGFKEQKHIETFARAFLNAGYIVVRWDTANTIGESEGKIEDATLTSYFEDFEDVVGWTKKQKWYREPFVVSGHSLGGACCILYSTKYPRRVKALAPISVFLSGKTYYDSLDKKDVKKWKKQGYILQESSSKPGVIKKLSWSLMEDLLKYDLFKNTTEIGKPTILIVGDEDVGASPRNHKKFMDKFSTDDKELHIIDGAPHTFKKQKHLEEIENIIYKWAKRISKL